MDDMDRKLVAALRRAEVEWICLAGYMRLLSPAFLPLWAVVALTECIHYELVAKESRVRVSALCPGAVATVAAEGLIAALILGIRWRRLWRGAEGL